ncbi:hypothetical protein NHJ13051_009853, partial [Beauveria bassiana]
MMHFALGAFVCLAFYIHPASADENGDFINNLLTDLAPCVLLSPFSSEKLTPLQTYRSFRKKVAMQFMSQSMGLADSMLLLWPPLVSYRSS